MGEDGRVPHRVAQQLGGGALGLLGLGLLAQVDTRHFVIAPRIGFHRRQAPVFVEHDQVSVGKEQGRMLVTRLDPGDLARRMIHAAQLRITAVASARTVEITLVVDGGIPVGFEALRTLGRILPHHLVTLTLQLEQGGADAVGLADQDPVPHHHGRAGVDGLELHVAPGKEETLPAREGLEDHQAAAGENQARAAAVDGGDDRAAVARQLVGKAVAQGAGELVEGDDTAAVTHRLARVESRAVGRAAPDLDDDQVLFDPRRAADTEEMLQHAETGDGIHVPEQGAVPDPAAL